MYNKFLEGTGLKPKSNDHEKTDRIGGGQPLDVIFDLEKYHKDGIKGQGIKVAIFDSGLGENYQLKGSGGKDLPNVVKIIDFTKEKVREELRSQQAVASADHDLKGLKD